MRQHRLLAAILVLALGLRLWNLDFGLPRNLHPDEPTILEPALRIADLSRFDPNPRFFNYPSLQIYVLSACLYVDGILSPGGSPARPALPDVAGAARVARWVTALFGTATVGLLYVLANRHFSRRAAQAAGLCLAVTPFHVLDSHYANVDVPMAFWILLSCVFALEHARSGRLRWLLVAAASVGLATATKYTALAATPLIAVAVLLGPAQSGGAASRLRRIGAGLGVCALAFLAAAPFTVLRLHDFLEALRFEQTHVQRGHWGFDLNAGGWVYHRVVYQLAAGFPFVLGLPLYLAALGGLVRTIRRPERSGLILAAACVPIFVVVAGSRVVFPRYLVPLLPFLGLLAAAFFAGLAAGRTKAIRLGGWIGGGAVLLYTVAFTASLTRTLKPQNAELAARWIEEHVPRGSAIAEGTFVPTLAFAAGAYRVEHFDVRRALVEGYRPEWLVMSGWFETSVERGKLRHGEVDRFFKSLAGSESAPYEVAARFSSHYLGEDFYARLDPHFKNQFESPDFTIYRRR